MIKGSSALAERVKHIAASILVVFALGCAAPGRAQSAPIVEAPAGRLSGETVQGVAVFRGIPYARAPVGDLRWRAPQPLPRWDGTREATQFGASCVQPASPFFNHPAVSEDCLFLNIWAPPNANNAPVLVWIHGGSLVSGSGSESIYDGAAFAGQGVIVISINYRLGALGWLAHPALSAETGDDVSGNYGLLDQIQALHWVRDNISAFGGDAHNVTIAGESAGALSVMLLLASPEARGLFARAIAQSPYMITLPELRNGTYADWPDAETIGGAVATALGASDAASLRALSTDAILEATARTRYFPLATVDGRILPRQMVDSFDRGEQAPVPVLAGYNEGEIRSLRFLLPPAPANGAAYTTEIRARYGELADAFLARYPADTLSESMLAATRDALYGWSAERLVQKQTALNAPSYLYYFDHGYPAADAANLRAFHAAEIPFMFGTASRTLPYWPAIPDTAEQHRLSEAMVSYWTSFARDGAPRAEGEAAWRSYGETRAYMAFEDVPQMRDAPSNGYSLHEQVVCRRRAQGGIAWHWNVGIIAPPLPPQAPQCRQAGLRAETTTNSPGMR